MGRDLTGVNVRLRVARRWTGHSFECPAHSRWDGQQPLSEQGRDSVPTSERGARFADAFVKGLGHESNGSGS